MNWRDPRLWLAAFSAMAVGLLAARDLSATSPGELAAVHGREEDLTGRGGCAKCHGSRGVTLAQACLECHADVAADIDEGHGLHGTFEEIVAPQCALCHGEHHGADFLMVNPRSFVIAGVPELGEFQHELVGFAMAGKHLELECTECHVNAHEPVLPEGARRYLGLEQDCVTCHEDPHDGRMARACAECHGQEGFAELAPFVHDPRFPLVGSHATPTCQECHVPESAHSVEADAARGGPPVWRDCLACHESPHAERLLDGVASLDEVAVGESCAACHDAEHGSFRGEQVEMTARLHAASGFPLDAPHDQAECADCHSPWAPRFELRYPGRPADECRACHQDPHGGQFDGGPFSGGCIDCHDRAHFDPPAFGVAEHEQTAMPLDGRHAETDCRACHEEPVAGGPRVFHGTPGRCESCHGDAHQGAFERFGAELAAVEAGSCAACHDASSFGGSAPDEAFEHARWTGFPLDGAHAQTTCESCHPRSAEPDRLGRTFGRASSAVGGVTHCVQCHADPHGGSFDRPGLQPVVEGRRDCARCHTATSFRDFPDGFDHGRWTGYPLLGAHRALSCVACHAPIPGGDREHRSFGRAAGTGCQDCHGDPHAGQFRKDGRTDCVRCHSTTQSFQDLSFDHERDARFPLGPAHAQLECARCHESRALASGDQVVRYRPIAHECRDCHGADAEQLERLREKAGR